MATLTVLKFETAIGAENALEVIKDLSKKQLIKLNDAAIVTWPVGKKKPKTRHFADLTGAGALCFLGHVIWPDIFYSFIGLGRWGCNRCTFRFHDPYWN